jgi:hypothetical protein
MDARIGRLVEDGLAGRQGQRIVFARNLLDTLLRREIEGTAARMSAETGLPSHPAAEGEHVAGIYRQRVTLASGRFAMIDDGLGFSLAPWSPSLHQQLGKQVSGIAMPGGGIDWNFGRQRGLGCSFFKGQIHSHHRPQTWRGLRSQAEIGLVPRSDGGAHP